MGVVMVMFRADGQRRSFSVTRDMTVIGRREDCDLRIPLSDVSRKHCRMILEGETIRVEDLGSSNGTYKNGERVQQTELAAGDTLQVGPVVFVVQVDGFPADEDLTPVTVAAAAAAAGGAAAGVAASDTDAEGEPEVLAEEDAVELASTGDSAAPGEFDPMEALESAEGSAFDFQIDESQHGEQSPVDADLEESGH
jgi:predicted component of type VI protein secretion system